MPTFNFACLCGKEWEGYIHNAKSENPLCECGKSPERVWALGNTHRGASTFPYITTNILPDGKPIEVTSASHLDSLCKQYNLTHRPDNAWLEKEYMGVDFRTGKQMYKEGSGRGMPGSWI